MDVLGSAYYDSTPRFAIPRSWPNKPATEDQPSPQLRALGVLLRQQSSGTYTDTATSLEKLSHLATHVNLNSHDPSFWKDGVKASGLIGNLQHHLLSLPKLSSIDMDKDIAVDTHLREVVRLAILIVLARLKISFSLIGDELATLQNKFHKVVASKSIGASIFPEIYLWSLVVVALSCAEDIKYSFLNEIHDTMIGLALRTGEEVIDMTRTVVWIPTIFDTEVARFCQAINASFRRPIGNLAFRNDRSEE
jgi:hypothetical protein